MASTITALPAESFSVVPQTTVGGAAVDATWRPHPTPAIAIGATMSKAGAHLRIT